jgi:methylaspartate ammonia-lyase
MPDYPEYTVNGVTLNQGQCMTIHVALQSLAMEMVVKNHLGSDETGEAIRKGYLKNIREINKIALG